jgi:glucose dehydrogenase
MRLVMTTGFLRRSLLATLAVGTFQVSSLTQTPPDWVQPPSRNFPVVGGNFGNQRHSTLRQIDRSTVSRVGGAWMVHLEDGSTIGNRQATPVVVDGVMYMGSS